MCTFFMTEAMLAVVWPKWPATCEASVLVCVHSIQSANAAALSQFFICVRRTMTDITVAMGQLSLLLPVFCQSENRSQISTMCRTFTQKV
jgi:hypothetical protein